MPASRIPKFLLSLSLLAAVMFLAACSEKSADTSTDSTTASLDDCTPEQLQTFADGKWTLTGKLTDGRPRG